jgi:hypothetical protein
MPERTELRTAVNRLAGRLRALPQRRLQADAAAEGLELARWLAREAQLLEFPGREPYRLPDDGAFTVGDQLAVAGNDLVAALANAEPQRGQRLLDEALARVSLTAKAVG